MSIDTATGEAAQAEVSTERVYGIFSAIARRYELFNAVSSMGLYRRWLATLVERAPITNESDLLDLAGGTGDVSFAAARMKRPRHIQLTDLVPEMLEVAREHERQGAARGVAVDFDVVDAQDIPYADNSYDVVTVAYGIRNMPDRERALREMHRVLKPGGGLACLEFSTPANPLVRALHGFYLSTVIPFLGGLITGDRTGFVYLKDSIRAFPRQEDFAAMMEDAGFQQVEWVDCSAGIAAVHTGVKGDG
ncbi:MAG: ubiquinone/menaquinone biosynthesis methyltransferase [Eggerthellaceae bacterium]|nr:ubiquinone/menaquinone biosynthesis methyltransferase [Eggerthellaceae bacterium]MDR2716125.1 ubiquinone/menaquinone biosynthesis methyltransferase [Coriobacteriaceae bacterium]